MSTGATTISSERTYGRSMAASLMPRPNVRLILQVYEALERKDVDALAALSSPEIQIHQSKELPWGGAYAGIEQALLFFAKVVSYLDSHVTVERVLDAGDRIVVIGRTAGSVKKTGRTFDVPLVHVWRVEQGKVALLYVFLDNPSMLPALLGEHHGLEQ